MFDNLLDYVRIALYTLLVVLGLFIVQAWQREHYQPPAATETPVVSAPNNHYIPAPTATASTANTPAVAASALSQTKPAIATPPPVTGQLITVTTGVLQIKIDTLGGDIVEAKLLSYPLSLGSSTPFLLLNNDANTRYIAESGLLSQQGPDTEAAQARYTADKTDYTFSPGDNELAVNLHWAKNGVNVTKTFTFTREGYEVKVDYAVDNQSNQPWEGNLYTQLMRTNSAPVAHTGFSNLTTYFGAAISSPDKPYQKVTFKQMLEKNLDLQSQDGWAAMIQHYFVGAWIPPKTAISNYYSRVTADGLYTIGMIGQTLKAPPGTQMATEAKLYAGPAIAGPLEHAAPALKLTIDYGWFWFISSIIFWMMSRIYDVVGNWGWSIVLVTIVIKIIFYPLSAKSYRSMSVMKKLQPRIEALKERFGDDKQKLTQATMELYKQEKVNPMSGCLPILIQIPVFIALYWVLVESVQLRQAPFIFWIHDLSQQDPYYILPILMGISMFIQQRLNPPAPDPIQAKVMMFMPVLFTVLFANFPAGLMVYWIINNTLSFSQQWYVMHTIDKETNGKKSRK